MTHSFPQEKYIQEDLGTDVRDKSISEHRNGFRGTYIFWRNNMEENELSYFHSTSSTDL